MWKEAVLTDISHPVLDNLLGEVLRVLTIATQTVCDTEIKSLAIIQSMSPIMDRGGDHKDFPEHHEEAANHASTFTAEDDRQYRRLLRSLDARIIPILAVLYLLSFLDRGTALCQHDPDMSLTICQEVLEMPIFKACLAILILSGISTTGIEM